MSQLVSLWKRHRSGAAFEQCVRAHVPRLFQLAWRLTRSTHDAEDLVQDALLRAHGRRDELLAMQAPGAWLARVLHNAWIDRWRRKGVMRHVASLDAGPDGVAAVDAAVEGGDDLQQQAEVSLLLRAIAELPDAQQSVVLLHDAGGFTLEEIGQVLDIPVGTCKSRLHRARAALRARFDDETFFAAAAFSGERR